MLILVGIWLAVAGGVAMLAGLSGLRRVRRLRRDGQSAWAVAVLPPRPADQEPAAPPSRPLLQYTLADGRVVERAAPAARKSAALEPGQRVLIWYDPEDPDDVLVYGHWGRASDRALLAAGAICVLAGLGLAVAGG